MSRFGQQATMSDQEVLEALDQAGPSKLAMKTMTVTGAEPQEILTLRSGLEVPADILKRDLERKRALVVETGMLVAQKPSVLLQIGHFANKQPMQACVMALAVGVALGTFFY